jgi:high-affinity iron transporter
MNVFLILFGVFLLNNVAYAVSGESIYKANCVICHGPTGAGDGPVGKALTPKPANYKDRFNAPKAFKNAAQLREHILLILEKGKNTMPAFNTLSDDDRKAVADYLIAEHYSKK